MQPHKTTANNLTSGYTETLIFSFYVFTVLCVFLFFFSVSVFIVFRQSADMIFHLHSLTLTTCDHKGQKQDNQGVPGRRQLLGNDKSHE